MPVLVTQGRLQLYFPAHLTRQAALEDVAELMTTDNRGAKNGTTYAGPAFSRLVPDLARIVERLWEMPEQGVSLLKPEQT